jgi:hypothetical protein
MGSLALSSPRTLSRHDRLRRHLRDAVALSFPLFTYKELKRMVRAQYHTFVMELREQRTWEEISRLTGMTRAGLNKLGDVVPPKVDANSVRTVLLLLQEAGDEGLRLGELAAAFYELNDLDGPDLRDAVEALVADGAIVEEGGRYQLVFDAPLYHDQERIGSAVASARAIAERTVQESGAGSHGICRLTLRVPEDEVHAISDRLTAALVDAAEGLESDSGTPVTVVLAAGPELV